MKSTLYIMIKDDADFQVLLEFAKARCDLFSVARYYDGRIDDAIPYAQQPSEIQEVFVEKQRGFERRIDRYRRILGLETEDEARTYLDALFNQSPDVIECEGSDEPFHTNHEEYVGKWYTHMSTVTIGPLFEVSYFRRGTIFDDICSQLVKPDDRNLKIEGFVFEDPAFYRNGECFLCISSHEHEIFLDIDEAELELLKQTTKMMDVEETGIEQLKQANITYRIMRYEQ